MNQVENTPNTKTAENFPQLMETGSDPTVLTGNDPFHTAPTFIIREHAAVQMASQLTQEIKNPLANICLSLEMLQSELVDNNLKIYLDIVSRNSMRINGLVQEIIQCQQLDETVLVDLTIQKLPASMIKISGSSQQG